MKVIKDRTNGVLARVQNHHAKEILQAKDLITDRKGQEIERFATHQRCVEK